MALRTAYWRDASEETPSPKDEPILQAESEETPEEESSSVETEDDISW